MSADKPEATATVDEQEELLLDHEYDGIREYDNPTPGWWELLFYGSIVFSICYWVFFEMGPRFSEVAPGWTVHEAYEQSVAADVRRRFSEIGELEPNQQTILHYMNDPEWMTYAQSVFKAQCVSCHGSDGSGLVGPNMTDNHYKNVKKIEDIPRVIAQGAANGAMPSFQNRLHPNDIVLLSAYAASLRGQNLISTRPAEGEVIPPWPEYVPAEPQEEEAKAQEAP